MAIAFRGLTNNFEKGFDAEMFDRQPSDLDLKIEGRTEPIVIKGIDYLDETMRLPLELYLDVNREVTFSLEGIENMSATVYLEDALDGRHYNLSEGSVNLTLDA